MTSRLNNWQPRGSKSVSLLRRSPPVPPTPKPPPRRRQEWSTAGCFCRTAPTRPDDPNRQARSSLPRTPARSTGGDRPSGTDMKRVAAARTTGCYRKLVPGTTKHTPAAVAPTHTSTNQSQWREALGSQLGTVLEKKGGPVQRRWRCSTKAVRGWMALTCIDIW
jgi:hypothetical protein